MKITTTESENIEVYLDQIEKDLQMTEDEVLKEMKGIVKNHTVEELRKLKRLKKIPEKRGKHMYEDVVASIVKDKYGDKVLRVRGGKNTGTLWHIVNDGTYKQSATHFLDRVITKAEKEFEKLTDSQLGKRSE